MATHSSILVWRISWTSTEICDEVPSPRGELATFKPPEKASSGDSVNCFSL